MPKIIAVNVGTEHALEHEPGGAHPFASAAWRSAWFAEAGDVLLSPVPIPDAFLRYVGETLGFDAQTVSVIARHQPLTDEVLRSEALVEELRAATVGRGPWSMMPCFATAAVAELASRIGIDGSALRFAAQGGCELLNRKSHFRRLAVGADLPLASGSIAHSPTELARAIRAHLPRTGTVIVKKDDAAGGMGNVTVTTGPTTPRPGSSETRSADEGIEPIAAELWERLTDPRSRVLVVESYYAAAHMFYFELSIDDRGCPRFLDSGTIRLRVDPDPLAGALVWVGLDIPAAIPSFSLCRALSTSMQLVMLAAHAGYRGYLNIDAIVTDEGEVVFNEVNGRWGGGLVLHAVAARLLGERYADAHCLSSLRDVCSPPRHEAVQRLRERGLHFERASQEGAIVLACDESRAGTMEYLLIGSSWPRVRELESRVRAALA